MQVTWRDGERWIGLSNRSMRDDRMDAWTTGDDQATCVNWSVIMAEINRRGSHLSRSIAIQRALFEAFNKAFHRIKSWPSITIRWPRLNRNGPRWTVSS